MPKFEPAVISKQLNGEVEFADVASERLNQTKQKQVNESVNSANKRTCDGHRRVAAGRSRGWIDVRNRRRRNWQHLTHLRQLTIHTDIDRHRSTLNRRSRERNRRVRGDNRNRGGVGRPDRGAPSHGHLNQLGDIAEIDATDSDG